MTILHNFHPNHVLKLWDTVPHTSDPFTYVACYAYLAPTEVFTEKVTNHILTVASLVRTAWYCEGWSLEDTLY